MIVANQHDVNRRQVLPGNAWYSPAPRAYPGERTRSFGPDRVRQNIAAALLKEQRGMIDERGSQSAAVDTARRFGWLDIGNEAGRPFRPGAEFPSQGIQIPGRLRGIRIVKALSVKVFRKHCRSILCPSRSRRSTFAACSVLRRFASVERSLLSARSEERR